jgi:secreted PhoX family phosphatase
MDRPEWTAVNPATGEMYCTLTNNSSRTPATTDAPNPRAYTDPKLPQGDVVNADPPTSAQATRGNANGHVIRLRETGDSSEALSFGWDIYAFGAGSDLNAANINLSGLDATNDFSSPDGLWFGLPSNASGTITPVMWIETDDGAYTDVTNCMLLASIPGTVGDGGTRVVNNTLTTAANVTTTSTVTTRIGKAPGNTLRRFLVGPKECEITGIHSTPDGRSLFINVQHPGENATNPNAPTSNWPANQTAAAPGQRPRSATVVITKTDGGVVGL